MNIFRPVLKTIACGYRPQHLTTLLHWNIHTTATMMDDGSDPLDHLKTNPYFDKYAKKLKDKQMDSPEDFKTKVVDIEEKKRQDIEAAKQAIKEEEKWRTENMQYKPKTLDSVMKIDLIKDKTQEEIEEIWKEYHCKKDFIFAVIPKEEYEEIYKRSQEYKTFLYPLPRASGYEFFTQQFSGHEIHFTPLVQYQAHKENAPTCLTISHFTELTEDKGIVLMRGEPDTKVLSVYESQLLALQVKMYYGLHSGLRFNYVRLLNTQPDHFKHMDLIKEFENYKKDSRDFRDAKQYT